MSDDRHMSRREALRLAATAGIALAAIPRWLEDAVSSGATGTSHGHASLTPELTEGPYWVNTMLHRSDVRSNTATSRTAPGAAQDGVPLTLTINVMDAGHGYKPLNGVAIDIWHANAYGLYSDETSQQPYGGTTSGDTSGQDFLRGYQVTGEDPGVNRKPVPGQVSFKTIWPGWYASRAIHIHIRARKLSHTGTTIAGYTTQVFFSDANNDKVLAGASPYSTRSPAENPTTDEDDTVLQRADFATNIAPVTGRIAKGFATTFDVVVQAVETTAKGSLARPNAGAVGGPPGAGGPRGPSQ
jgi:protocatechuate 3,4-dioxygenase beta subunit